MSRYWKRLIATAMMAGGIVYGQGRGPFGPDSQFWSQRRVEHLAARLSLTDAQKQQALTIFTTADQATEPIKNNIDQARQTLREAARKGLSNQQIDQLAANVGMLMGQLLAVETKASAAFYNTLTPEQKQKMDQAPERRGPGFMNDHSGRGPMMPDRPGMSFRGDRKRE